MKHRIFKVALVSVMLASGIGTISTNSNVQARIIRSTRHKYSMNYFNKWRTIKLTKRTRFTEDLNNLAPQSLWNKYQRFQLKGRSRTLPKGSIIKVKSGKYNWLIKSKSLPTPKHNYHWSTLAISKYIKYKKPVVAPSEFRQKRTVQLTRNVKMVKQRQGMPLAFTRTIGFKTLKKGTVITAQDGGHYPYMVWSKQLPVSNETDFWTTGQSGKWYKILD